MPTNIIPHVPLSPDHPIEVIIGFGADVPADADWPDPLDLFARFVTAGGFVESCPQLNWKVTVLPHGLHVTYERLPADPSVLAVLVRMLLALALPPSTIHVQGTPAASGARSLPSTPAALDLVPNVRPQLAFGLEMETGLSWLCIEVSCSTTLDPAAAALVDQRLELWCKVCRAGGLSKVGADQTVEPGQAGKYEPSVGEDFLAVEIMYGEVAIAAPGALPNLLDELARGGVPISGVSIR